MTKQENLKSSQRDKKKGQVKKRNKNDGNFPISNYVVRR